MSSLRSRTIRLAYENPPLRAYLLPMISRVASDDVGTLRSMPMASVVTYTVGSGFSRRSFQAIKTEHGWFRVDVDERNRVLYGQIQEPVDLEGLVATGEAGGLGDVLEGISKGDRIKHPITLLGLPRGAVVANATYDKAGANGEPLVHENLGGDRGWTADPENPHKGFDVNYFDGEIKVGQGLYWIR